METRQKQRARTNERLARRGVPLVLDRFIPIADVRKMIWSYLNPIDREIVLCAQNRSRRPRLQPYRRRPVELDERPSLPGTSTATYRREPGLAAPYGQAVALLGAGPQSLPPQLCPWPWQVWQAVHVECQL